MAYSPSSVVDMSGANQCSTPNNLNYGLGSQGCGQYSGCQCHCCCHCHCRHGHYYYPYPAYVWPPYMPYYTTNVQSGGLGQGGTSTVTSSIG